MFKNFIMENFPFLENDFDALTDYELFCKMMEYVKQFAEDNEEFKKKIEDLETYIYNLDLQEEVDNKLDVMASDGTLEALISEYLELKITYSYNNVSAMKLATNLINGCFAKTNGYFNIGDGGDAYYYVRTITNDDVVDERTIIALSDDTLVAVLLIKDVMSVKCFGSYGDGTHDDTEAIQTALNNCKKILIDNGTYLVDASDGILLKSNQYIKGINSKIVITPNDLETYSIITIDDVDNLIIENLVVEGDKLTHTGASGEQGHCLTIADSTRIIIRDSILSKGWGDGIYVGDGNENIIIDNVLCDSNRRNGISVIDVDNCKIINSTISNTDGTSPECGIDIEPNNGNECKNIIIDNCIIKGNDGNGIHTANRFYETTPDILNNITISNNIITTNGGMGIRPSYVDNLIITGNTIENNTSWGINLSDVNKSIVSNNSIDNNGAMINLYHSHYNLIDSNKCDTSTANNNHGCIIQGGNYNVIRNNIITKAKLSGLVITSTSSTEKSEYNIVENNKIFDNGTYSSDAYNNIAFNNYTSYNIVKDNNFIGTNTNLAYNINFTSSNSGSNNYVIGNIMVTQTSGDIYARSNKLLDNIIDGTLSAGNMRS